MSLEHTFKLFDFNVYNSKGPNQSSDEDDDENNMGRSNQDNTTFSIQMFGINENNFNLRAAEAAERLGIDLNLAELNPSNNIAFANNMAAKNYFASKAVDLHNQNINNRVRDILEENLSLVGPKKTKKVKQENQKIELKRF
mgnify:CR=1 FL=1